VTAPKPFVDQIRDVVEATSCKVLASLQRQDSFIKTINYIHGPADEIRETLCQQDEDPIERYGKYPLIVLITPFRETAGGGYYSKVFPRIGIVHHTEQDKKSKERYLNNIEKVLMPIYDAFTEALVNSGYFVLRSERDLKITRLIRDDIGRRPFLNIEGISNDFIDAIEIPNIELTIDYANCFNCKNIIN
jgi:hypothetical protein